MIIRFQPVTCRDTFRGKCRNCGKRCQQTIKVERTVNPFNRTIDGIPKTPQEVRSDVNAEFLKLKAVVIAKGPQCTACQHDRNVQRLERIAARRHPLNADAAPPTAPDADGARGPAGADGGLR